VVQSFAPFERLYWQHIFKTGKRRFSRIKDDRSLETIKTLRGLQMNKHWMLGLAVTATALVAGCGSDSGSGVPTPTNYLAEIAVPNTSPGTSFSFDLGLVTNHGSGRYYFTDRNNKAVDVVDIASGKLIAQVTGTGANAFTGCLPVASCAGANNGISGPDGINDIFYTGVNKIYVGDVNSVKVLDPTTLTITKTITNVGKPGSGNRADEGCFDAVHHLYWISSPEEDIPVATIINTDTDAIVAKITFTDLAGAPSAGLEQCRYDSAADLWFVNNDGTTANPDGELDVVTGASVRGIAAGATVNYTTLAGVKMYNESTPTSPCDPTGLALGPGNDIAVNCRPGTVGAPLVVKIFDRTNGNLVASVPAGGGDQLEYDPTTNRYFSASSRWNNTGKAINAGGSCSAAAPCNPVLGIIDATSKAVITLAASGNNAHSVAVDPVSGHVFVPHSSAASPAGATLTPFFQDFYPVSAAGGVTVYSAR
jgi:hypothetical protein